MGDGLGQVEVQRRREQEEEPGDLGQELSPLVEGQPLDGGDLRHDGAVTGSFARSGERTSLPGRVQARAARDAEEIRLADGEAFVVERGMDISQGETLAAQLAGPVV